MRRRVTAGVLAVRHGAPLAGVLSGRSRPCYLATTLPVFSLLPTAARRPKRRGLATLLGGQRSGSPAYADQRQRYEACAQPKVQQHGKPVLANRSQGCCVFGRQQRNPVLLLKQKGCRVVQGETIDLDAPRLPEDGRRKPAPGEQQRRWRWHRRRAAAHRALGASAQRPAGGLAWRRFQARRCLDAKHAAVLGEIACMSRQVKLTNGRHGEARQTVGW